MTSQGLGFTLAALYALASPQAAAADCTPAALDESGGRILVNDCLGACGVYQVGDPTGPDLHFGSELPDVISFEFYSPDTGYPRTGTFDLGSGLDANFGTCEQCIIVYQDYTDPNTPTKTFFQTAGTITIDSNTIPGVSPAVGLSWEGVTLAEVTIDPETFTSTLVPGGACYTIVVNDLVFRNGFEF
jgi:hypothetical protein